MTASGLLCAAVSLKFFLAPAQLLFFSWYKRLPTLMFAFYLGTYYPPLFVLGVPLFFSLGLITVPS